MKMIKEKNTLRLLMEKYHITEIISELIHIRDEMNQERG